MEKIKISLVTTVLNEEASIETFLKSVFRQTKMPDEMVIVDGGSTDSTVDKVKSLKLKVQSYSSKLKIIKKRGNRSVGRNEAIEHAGSDVIAVTDAGCVLDRNWLKNIVKPFENKEIDAVAGFYKPIMNSIFEKCLATYTCTMPDQVQPGKFLPSSRSVAFRKVAWEKVRGYPEELDTCEDLIFDRKLEAAGFKFVFAKNAIVYWPQRKNIFKAASQFFNYAQGDGEARYLRPQTLFLFARYIIGVLLIILFMTTNSSYLLSIIYYLLFFYLLWAVAKNYKYVNDIRAFVILPALQFTADIAVLSGTSIGFTKTLWDIRKIQ